MKNIKDILGNHEMTPSDNCWQQISQRLDQMMPQSEGSAPENSGGVSHGPASTMARVATVAKSKLILAAVGLAIAGGVITLTTVSLLKDSPTPATSAPAAPATEIDTVVTESEPETTYDPAPAKNTTEVSHNESVRDDRPAATDPKKQPSLVNTPQSTPSIVETLPVAPAPRPITPPKPVAPPTNVTIPAQHSTSAQADPVVLEHPEMFDSTESLQKLEIPNVFTPNGDGINDFFVILGSEQCTKRQLTVRDRNGKTVYHANLYENNWDGGDCPDGTYFYQFTFGYLQLEETLQGSVTIIRK
ncbi:MAG: gliding motility-associated C-terminal domain-containing protein [Bacteroidales bacterium]|nr:gliding motility-associated C-terminal domain-containing protein [Bacteroidales bacterium]